MFKYPGWPKQEYEEGPRRAHIIETSEVFDVHEAFVKFFDKVYRLVSMIPKGKVASYGQIARMLGSPRGARTVGWALHGLPDGTDVPWHRVINSQGRISTSCLQHDANLQRELLEAEGVVFDERDRVNWEVYGWEGLDWAELDALWRAD